MRMTRHAEDLQPLAQYAPERRHVRIARAQRQQQTPAAAKRQHSVNQRATVSVTPWDVKTIPGGDHHQQHQPLDTTITSPQAALEPAGSAVLHKPSLIRV